MRFGELRGVIVVGDGEEPQSGVAQGAATGRGRVRAECASRFQFLVESRERRAVGIRNRPDQPLAGIVDRFGIDRRVREREFALARRHQHQCGEGVILVGARNDAADGFDIGRIGHGGAARFDIADHADENFAGQFLTRFPAVESIRVVAHQEGARRCVLRSCE